MSIYPITIKSLAIRRAGKKGQRGSVALAAVTALVIVFIIAIGLLALGNSARLSGKRALSEGSSQALAADGVEYGYWQVAFNNQPLPYTNSRSLGGGGFSVTVTDNSASIAGTVKLVSTGTQNRASRTVTRVMSASQKMVFDYALASSSVFSPSQTIVTGASSANGDTRVNGNLSLSSATVINGDALATGAISGGSVTGAKASGSAALPFTTINTAYYQSIATRVYTGSTTFSGIFPFFAPNEVIFVNGNANLHGVTFTGIGTIVVTGTVTISGSVSYLFSSDKAAFLCPGGLTVSAANANVVGFYYVHNSSGNATATFSGSQFTLTSGSFAADLFSISASGRLTLIHDPAMNATLGKQMSLPGY